MFSFIFNNFFLFCDGAPGADKFKQQDPVATAVAEGTLSFHNYLIFLVILIGTAVLVVLYFSIKNFDSEINKIPTKFTHSSLLEIIWTIVPAGILVLFQTVVLLIIFFFQLKEKEELKSIKSQNVQLQIELSRRQEEAAALHQKMDIASTKLDAISVEITNASMNSDIMLWGLYAWIGITTLIVLNYNSTLLLKFATGIGIDLSRLISNQRTIGINVSELVAGKRELLGPIVPTPTPVVPAPTVASQSGVDSIINIENLPLVDSMVNAETIEALPLVISIFGP